MKVIEIWLASCCDQTNHFLFGSILKLFFQKSVHIFDPWRRWWELSSTAKRLCVCWEIYLILCTISVCYVHWLKIKFRLVQAWIKYKSHLPRVSHGAEWSHPAVSIMMKQTLLLSVSVYCNSTSQPIRPKWMWWLCINARIVPRPTTVSIILRVAALFAIKIVKLAIIFSLANDCEHNTRSISQSVNQCGQNGRGHIVLNIKNIRHYTKIACCPMESKYYWTLRYAL